MLYEPDRHEPLAAANWDEGRARELIRRIVRDTERSFVPASGWPVHPRDAADAGALPQATLYFGAAGVIWALHYLQRLGAAGLDLDHSAELETMIERNRIVMDQPPGGEFGSYLMGDTGIRLVQYAQAPSPALADRLEALIRATIDHPCRELMWGAPGTMLAALFMQRHSAAGGNGARWAELFRSTAERLRSQLEWSAEFGLHCWSQDMYGGHHSFIDAVHGFVATAAVLIQGRDLLDGPVWTEWSECIANTVQRTADRDGALVNWRAQLFEVPGRRQRRLVQFCHGAPGFVVCLSDFPQATLDELLRAGGETTWQAGPLRKGANLCHGTAGNGYAFLKLHRRFGEALWLERARAFAMHAIDQAETDRTIHGQWQYSLWTGDLGLAIYLWDCIRGGHRFPTLDVFFAD